MQYGVPRRSYRSLDLERSGFARTVNLDPAGNARMKPIARYADQDARTSSSIRHDKDEDSRSRIVASPWRYAGGSCQGTTHSRCDDVFSVRRRADGGINLALADGVTRGDHGHAAALAVVRHCTGWIKPPSDPSRAWHDWMLAGENVAASAVRRAGGSRGAACMVAAAVDVDGWAWLSHVGDCRAYLLVPDRYGRLDARPLTRDETFREHGIRPPPGIPHRNPMRMLGLGTIARIGIRHFLLPPGSGLLLTTDGVHEYADPADKRSLWPHTQTAQVRNRFFLTRFIAELLTTALNGGSGDDRGAIVLWRDMD